MCPPSHFEGRVGKRTVHPVLDTNELAKARSDQESHGVYVGFLFFGNPT